MMKTLLARLLLWAVFFQAEGHGAPAGQPKAQPGRKKVTAETTDRMQGASADAPVGSPRVLSVSQLALASAPIRTSRLLAAPAVAQPDSTRETAKNEPATFDPATANLPASLAIALRRPEAPLGRRTYRPRLVRTGRWATRREAVEVLTCTYAGPLVLALLPASGAASAQVLAGPGYDATVPLRPLELTSAAVLRLCGDRAPQVQAYARLYNLHFQQAEEVARMLDYYNRIAAVKE